MAYRLDCDGASVCYVTDTAPFTRHPHRAGVHPPAAAAGRSAEARRRGQAARDARRRRAPVRRRRPGHLRHAVHARGVRGQPHWGHSCPKTRSRSARAAGAKGVVLFHHAPERTDDQIDELLAYHRKQTPDLDLVAAAEGMERPRQRSEADGGHVLGRARLGAGAGTGDEPLRRQHLLRASCARARGDSSSSTSALARSRSGASCWPTRSARAAARRRIFLSHAHWDHIQGFPFFAPVFVAGQQVHRARAGRARRRCSRASSKGR